MVEDIAAKDTYPSVMDYLREKYLTLRNNYKTPDGRYSESCGLIACDIAKLFLDEGEKTSLFNVKGETLIDGVNRKAIAPRIYEGNVEWGGHKVCVRENIVYDPMVGKPMKIEEYASEIFYEPVILEETVSPELIEEFLNRGKKLTP